VQDAAARVREAGFTECREERLWGGGLLVLQAVRPREAP
jgi:hypothetical protein